MDAADGPSLESDAELVYSHFSGKDESDCTM